MAKRPEGADAPEEKPQVEVVKEAEAPAATPEPQAEAAPTEDMAALKQQVVDLATMVRALAAAAPAPKEEGPREWPPSVKGKKKTYRWKSALSGMLFVHGGQERTDPVTGMKTQILPPVMCQFRGGIYETDNTWIQERIEAFDEFKTHQIEDIAAVKRNQLEVLRAQVAALEAGAPPPEAPQQPPGDIPDFLLPPGANPKPDVGVDPAQFRLDPAQEPPAVTALFHDMAANRVMLKPRLQDIRSQAVAAHPTEAER